MALSLLTFCAGRLQFLDTTLARIIQRFEDEYPETRVPPIKIETSRNSAEGSSLGSGEADLLSNSTEDVLSKTLSDERIDSGSLEPEEPYGLRLSRTSSNTSLRTRALDSEEGRMHRFGQQVRRSILKPQGLDYAHGTNESDVDPPHLAVLRSKLEALQGDEIRRNVMEKGLDKVLEELGANADQLALLEMEDPDGFQKFKEAQIAAQVNMQRAALVENGSTTTAEQGGGISEPAGQTQGEKGASIYDAATLAPSS